jgi:glycosyltransferase involved in cell wall biosynthesis
MGEQRTRQDMAAGAEHRGGGPLVSVIVPAFNASAFLDVSIGSILEQAWPRLEILVVDDGSQDGTWEKLAQLAAAHPEVVPLRNGRAKGPSGARNTGLDAARGDYIAFLDADDAWLKGHLERGVVYLETEPGVDVVFFNFSVEDFDTGASEGDWFARVAQLDNLVTRDDAQGFRIIEDGLFSALLQESFLHLQSMILRRASCGDLRFDESLVFGEDCDFGIKLRVEGGACFAYSPEITGVYHRHGTSLTADRSDKATRAGLEASLRRSETTIGRFESYLRKYDLKPGHLALITGALQRRYAERTYLLRRLQRFGEALDSLKASWGFGKGRRQAVEFVKLAAAAAMAAVGLGREVR